MAMVKRWWWIGAIVVVAGLATYMFLGRGTTAPPVTPGTADGGSVSPTATTTGTSTPVATATMKVVPPKIVTKGAELATVTVPPTETIAQIKYTAARNGRIYDARFRVYGTGPVRGGNKTVVALIDRWTPQKTYKGALLLTGKNVLFELGSGVMVTKGGTYDGDVKLMKRGSVIVFRLTEAKAR